MKIKKVVIIITLSLSLILIMLSNNVQANLLAECNICNATGNCDLCNGTGENNCDQCNGTGEEKCDQCNGTGKFQCHICNGSKQISCDCGGVPNCPNCKGTGTKTCPQCNGIGTLNCNRCEGAGTFNCNGCSGKGYDNCHRCGGDGKCNSCKGTGYLSGNNNGVNNIPKKGDTVQLLSGKTIKFGGSNSETSDESSSSSSSSTTTNNSKNNSNQNNNSSNNKGNNQEVEEEPQEKKNNYFISEDRTEINIGKNEQAANASLNSQNMTETEHEIIKNMPTEELEKIVQNIDTIISTAKVGEVSEESSKAIETMLEKNGYNSESNIKLCKLNFDGHISLEFPIKVSVNIDENMFNEGDTIFVYHILEDGTIESLGQAQGYADNGKVTRIEFSTKGFSDFFVTTENLNLNAEIIEEPVAPVEEKIEIQWMYIFYGAAIIVILIIIVIIIKRTKNKNI